MGADYPDLGPDADACGGYCYWKGGLVRVDLLYNKFPVKVRCGINIATAILVLICMGLVLSTE